MEQNEASGRYGTPPVLQRMFSFRVPAYQPALAIILLIILFLVRPVERYETIRYAGRTDTVFLEKKIVQSQEAQIRQMSPVKTVKKKTAPVIESLGNKTGKHGNDGKEPLQNQYVQNAYQKIRMVDLVKAGRNANEDSVLMKFLVASN